MVRSLVVICITVVLAMGCVCADPEIVAGNTTEPAQPVQPQPRPPATKLEAFMSSTGQLFVQEAYPVGVLEYGSVLTGGPAKLEADAIVVYQPSKEADRIRGLSIEIQETGRYGQTETKYLDFEELEGLFNALTYIDNLAEKWKGTKRDGTTTVTYVTKSHFQVGFTQTGDKRKAIALCGEFLTAAMRIEMDDFILLRNMVDNAFKILKDK